MTPTHPHPTPPPAADTVAPVTVPRTYRERVEAIRTGGTLAGQKVRLRCIDIAAEADAALDAARLTNREWIAANGPGGWVDDLRKRAERAEAERDAIRAAMPSADDLGYIADVLARGDVVDTLTRRNMARSLSAKAERIRAALAPAAVAGDGADQQNQER